LHHIARNTCPHTNRHTPTTTTTHGHHRPHDTTIPSLSPTHTNLTLNCGVDGVVVVQCPIAPTLAGQELRSTATPLHLLAYRTQFRVRRTDTLPDSSRHLFATLRYSTPLYSTLLYSTPVYSTLLTHGYPIDSPHCHSSRSQGRPGNTNVCMCAYIDVAVIVMRTHVNNSPPLSSPPATETECSSVLGFWCADSSIHRIIASVVDQVPATPSGERTSHDAQRNC